MKLDRVCNELSRRIETLARSEQPTLRELWRAALDVEHIVLCGLLTPEEEARVLADPRVAALRRSSQCVFRWLETRIENSMAEFVRREGTDLRDRGNITQTYLARYEHLAAAEIELAGISEGDRALFIGSGPLPITAIEYCWQTGCTADCVDIDRDAVTISTEIVERLGLRERMRCLHGPGQSCDVSKYDVVLVGVLAQPKQAILENLDTHAKSGCRILCRTTYGLRQLIYEGLAYDSSALARLSAVGKSVAVADRIISAELLLASRAPVANLEGARQGT